MKYDVVVLGGGPGGCATAIGLAREGLRVALLERRTSGDSPRVGEIIAPAARDLFKILGVWDQFILEGHAPSPGTLSAWGSDELSENHSIFNPYGSGWHVDRNRLDAMLAQAAERAGAQVFLGARVEKVSGRWSLEIGNEKKSEKVEGAFLVDATGRAGAVARWQGSRRIEVDRLVGLVRFFRAPGLRDHRLLVEAVENGWWYSALLPNARLVVVQMTDADLKPSEPARLVEFWDARLEETIHTRARVNGATEPSRVMVQSANTMILDRMCGENWLAVGDVAMAVDPLSARGIYNALESGLRAARAIVEKQRGKEDALNEYEDKTREQYERYLRARTRYYTQETRWSQANFWKRRRDPKG